MLLLCIAILACGAATVATTLNFDDIILEGLYGDTPQRYHNFIIKHNDASWMNPHIGLINTLFSSSIGPFTSAAPSLPNALVASGDLIYIHHSEEGTPFNLLLIEAKAMALDQEIHFFWDGGNHRSVLIKQGILHHIPLNLTNITFIEFGCKTHRIQDICAPILYDNLVVGDCTL